MKGALRGGLLQFKYSVRYEDGYSPHRVSHRAYLQHVPCLRILFEALPTADTDLFFEITKAHMVLHSASIQAAVPPLKSNTRLLSCYLVISLYSPARRHATPRGVQQTPKALPLIQNTQPTMTAGEERNGGLWGHFMFKLEQREI